MYLKSEYVNCKKCKLKTAVKKTKNSAGHHNYFCKHCMKNFVETKDTYLYNKKLKEKDILQICKELIKQKSIRQIAQKTHHHKDTICHLIDTLAMYAPEVNKKIVCKICKNEHEQYEFWRWIEHRKRKFSKQAIDGLHKIENMLKG